MKVFGTSSDTTSSVIANPKTASLNPSSRLTSPPRHRKAVGLCEAFFINCWRIIAVPRLFHAPAQFVKSGWKLRAGFGPAV